MKSSSGLPSTRAAQAGIVPLTDRPPGEALPGVLIGVTPFGRRRAAPAMRAQSTPRPLRPAKRRSSAIEWNRKTRVKVAKAALLSFIAERCGPAGQRLARRSVGQRDDAGLGRPRG